MSAFGQELKALREALRLSQSKLAERAGFDHTYVSRLEAGSRFPSRDAVESLAVALEASPADRNRLLKSAGFASEDEPDVEQFRALPADLRRAALEFIEKVRAA